MPMFICKNNIPISLARDQIKLIHKVKGLCMRRANIFNQIGFLLECLKMKITPKGLKVKLKIPSEKCFTAKCHLETSLIKEALNQLFYKRRNIHQMIEKFTQQLIWEIHPNNWLHIRDYLLQAEHRTFLWTKGKLNNKLSSIIPKTKKEVQQNPKSIPTERVINLSSHALTKNQEILLNKGPNFNLSSNYVNKLDIAVETENTMRRNKLEDPTLPNKINEIINKNIKNPPNISKEEKIALKELQINQEIVIVKSDKGNQFVIMDKLDYDKKLDTAIFSEDYKKLEEDPTIKLDSELKKIVSKIGKKIKKDENLFDKIITQYTRHPTIFANPKVHKEGTPFRIIMSSYQSVLSNAAKFVTPILQELLQEIPGENLNIKNIFEAKEKIQEQPKKNEQFFLFSLDIINMYGNINPERAFNLIKNLTDQCTKFKAISLISKTTFLSLVKLILENSYFYYKNEFFNQTKGLPMGSPTSPAIAYIYMKQHETKWNNLPFFQNLDSPMKFMDDYLAKWTGTKEELATFVKSLNQIDPDINFTVEIEEEQQIPFLDATLTRSENNISFRTYRKQIASDTILQANTFQAKSITNSVIQGEANRVLKISDEQEQDLNLLKNRLINNNYKEKEIDKIFRNTKKKYNQKNTGRSTPKQKGKNSDIKPIYISYKYLGKRSKALQKTLKQFNLKLINKKPNTLEGIFNSKFKYKNNINRGIIYQVFCECGKTYIGETALSMADRQYTHERSIRTKDLSNALAFHVHSTGHSINWLNSIILNNEYNKINRKYREAFYIQKLKPELNFSEGFKIKGKWSF